MELNMKIIIAGGTGFIGQAMVQYFANKKYQCAIIGRSEKKIKKIFGDKVKAITWEQILAHGSDEIKTADAIINLTGANIGEKRWTEKRKIEIIESRIIPTRILAELCAKLGKNSPPLLNASAVGVYGLQPSVSSGLPPALDETKLLDFETPPDFLAKIGQEWELATMPAKEAGVRVVNMRFGVVLGKSGGVLTKLKIPFLFFIGGPVGNGQQPFSWVALTDLLRAVEFLLAHPEIVGPVNIVAPQCVTQKELAKALGKALHRPSFMTTPGFILKLVYGQMADELLLRGQHVIPSVLPKYGFKFQYPNIQSALNATFLAS
jgi:uncharacterized protein (TIGR01777 family)